jgi:hypothetical protein
LARVPELMMSIGSGKSVIIAYAIAVLFVWLNFAVHVQYQVANRFTRSERARPNDGGYPSELAGCTSPNRWAEAFLSLRGRWRRTRAVVVGIQNRKEISH